MALKLGELLIQNSLLTATEVDKALQTQKLYGGKLGTNLVELGFISEIDLATFLAKQLNMTAATAKEFENISPSIIELLPKSVVEKFKFIPIRLDQKLHVAISDPAHISILNDLGSKMGKSIQPVISPEIWIIAALERYYGIIREVSFVQLEDSDESIPIIATLDTLEEMTQAAKLPKPASQKENPLQDYCTQLLAAHAPESILTVLQSFLAPLFPYSALYLINREMVQGWLVRGFPLRNSEFAKTRAPLASNAFLRRMVQKPEPHSGPLTQTPENQTLFGLLDIPYTRSVAVYPIQCKGKVLFVFLGVPKEDRKVPRPYSGNIVPEAISRAQIALEIVYLERQLKKSPLNN